MTDPTTETITGLRNSDTNLTTHVVVTDVISTEAVAGSLVPPAVVVEVFFLPKSRRVRFVIKCLRLVSVLRSTAKRSMVSVI